MNATEEQAKVYRFATLQELVDRVPANRIRDCMEELGTILATAKASTELANEMVANMLRQSGKSVPELTGPVIKLPAELEWIDDGKRELEATLTDETGKRYWTVKAQPNS